MGLASASATLTPRLVSDVTVAHVAISERTQWLLFAAMGADSRWLAPVVAARLQFGLLVVLEQTEHLQPPDFDAPIALFAWATKVHPYVSPLPVIIGQKTSF